jgi:hypothetical protein
MADIFPAASRSDALDIQYEWNYIYYESFGALAESTKLVARGFPLGHPIVPIELLEEGFTSLPFYCGDSRSYKQARTLPELI